METILNVLPYIFWVLIALSILVFVHELGHFLAAKLFGMRVEQFSIGFPPKIVGKQIGETEYRIGAVPLGGYVKISGMIDESLDAAYEASEPEPWEFRSKPVWQRIIVICAGVIFNLIFAIMVFIGLKYVYGETYVPAERVESLYIDEEGLAHRIGMRTGDRIVMINGEPFEKFNELLGSRVLSADQVTITVDRQGRQMTLNAPEDLFTQLIRSGDLGIFARPFVQLQQIQDGSAADEAGLERGDRVVAVNQDPVRTNNELTRKIQESQGNPITLSIARPKDAGFENLEITAAPRQSEGRYLLGVGIVTIDSMLFYPEFIEHRPYGFGEAIVEGVKATWINTVVQVQGLKKIAIGQENFRENVGGPVKIAQFTKEAAEQGGEQFWRIVALLSIVLAIMNILPIPALDGGHLVFLIYEGITRREPSLRFRMAVQQIGMVFIFLLMAFLIFNDIVRL